MVDFLFRNVHLCSTKFSAPNTKAHFLTSQTGGQPYSDTSPLSAPCFQKWISLHLAISFVIFAKIKRTCRLFCIDV